MGWGQAQFGMYRAAWDIVALRAFWDAAARGMLRCGRFVWGGATVQFDMSRPPTAAEETERSRSIPPTMLTRPPALDVASTRGLSRAPLAYGLFAGRWGVAHLLHTTCNAHLSPNIQRAPVIVSHSICASYLRPCSACMLGSAERLRRACRDVQTRQQAGKRRA